MKEKRFSHDWERIDEEGYSPRELAIEVLEDPDLADLEKIIIGQYTPGYDTSIDDLLEYLIEHKDKLQHIKSFFFGDMDYMECEVSWIEQGNYEEFLKAFPNIKELIIKGSNNLSLGDIDHPNLENLEIITGGLPKLVIEEITRGKLTNLKSLLLYFGVEEYGFDGGIEDIRNLVENGNFPNLREIGLVNSEIQDEIVEMFLDTDLFKQIKVLSFGKGTFSDKAGQLLLEQADKLSHLDLLDLEFNYLSDEMLEKLKNLPVGLVRLGEQQEVDEYEYNGKMEYYMYPLLTE